METKNNANKFKIPFGGKDNDSINRTIRWQGSVYDRLMDIVDTHKVSFNRLVNECVMFALDRIDTEEDASDNHAKQIKAHALPA